MTRKYKIGLHLHRLKPLCARATRKRLGSMMKEPEPVKALWISGFVRFQGTVFSDWL